MEQFRRYMGRRVNLNNMKDTGKINGYGIICTYIPDPPEEFDEFEFKTEFSELEDIIITLAIESGKIARIMFSLADKENPDVVRRINQSQIEEFLMSRNQQLIQFFEFITK
ncbi:hypothetical protein [Desulfofundulus sp.]|uniref:hypothetical protein n=1 Tax=Desulfofundulus sp. TaxID=2282750 RepID=UPI003C763733